MSVSASNITYRASGNSAVRRNPVLLVISVCYAAIAISMSLIFFAVLIRHSLPVTPSAAGFALMVGISVALGIGMGSSGLIVSGDQKNASDARVPPVRSWLTGVKKDLTCLVALGFAPAVMILQYFEGRPREADNLPAFFIHAWIHLCCGIWAFVCWRRSGSPSKDARGT